ncbi:cytochrome P450 [Streptomyces agglomeratus]|uniref:Cytochrome P450 n=1 Tax=Streptomyces agglomeratus TaxID=285458 RepID=A0A1E5PK38_9ACTN|nr:cytochrome P450 [Streptomyces agglomeratus]OEJ29921.1 cytochrome P450 [Streptomyces agglomeratus]OEJ42060.1 cytochrome P450 [Streptomyces agglomeratus]OEJ49423.1 cytochrome P450 [Streptomyces agglomeratus]
MRVPPVAFLPIAGPRGLPLLGNLPAFGRDPLAFLVRLRDDFGDVVTWSLGPMRIIFLSHPEHIAELLGADERRYETPDVGWSFRRLVGDSVIRSQGADWRRKRSLVQPTVRPRQVRTYATTMVDCASALADRWQDRERIDVLREMTLLTQRIVVRTLFGNDVGDQARALGDAMSVAGREIGAELRGVGLFLPVWARTPARRRLLDAVATVDAEIDRLIRTRQASQGVDGEREDLLSRLLAARDETGRPLTPTEVRDEAVTLWVGGHETTSTALMWSWYLLSASAHAQARLTAELDRVLAGRPPTIDDYEQLTWTQKIIKEALRLYPPGWMIPPRVAQDGAVLGGSPVPAGTMVWCSQWVTHRDPRWFPDPTAFRPERWDDNPQQPVHQHAWFPFGGGQRSCLGARFALVEAALVLATLAQRFHITVDPGEVTPTAGLQLQPATSLKATLRALSACPPGGQARTVPTSSS